MCNLKDSSIAATIATLIQTGTGTVSCLFFFHGYFGDIGCSFSNPQELRSPKMFRDDWRAKSSDHFLPSDVQISTAEKTCTHLTPACRGTRVSLRDSNMSNRLDIIFLQVLSTLSHIIKALIIRYYATFISTVRVRYVS